ncbi:MAG: hypothetical protein KF753_10210 [Caldilineaceae bacterium]|nr:hypothetical protein [Caldilineaceae bacterium]
MTELNLQKLERNAQRAFNQDGLMHLFLGLLLVLTGLSFYDSRLGGLAGLAVLLIFPFRSLRQRIIYPRVGYVAFFTPKDMGRRKLTLAVVMTVSLAALVFIAKDHFPAMPIGFGLLLGLVLGFSASTQYGIRLRDWILIVAALVSGVVTAYLFADWRMATALAMWLLAVLLILVGTVELVIFLRQHPIMTQDDSRAGGGDGQPV